MIGPRAAIDPTVDLTDRLKTIERRIAQLEGLATVGDLRQEGVDTAGTDSSGDITITFPITYSSAPNFRATPRRNASASTVAHTRTISPTQAVVRITSNDAALTSDSSVDLHWEATGTL